jgi:hypothetical protein
MSCDSLHDTVVVAGYTYSVLANNELESARKEATMSKQRYLPGVCLEGSRKRTKNIFVLVSVKIRTEYISGINLSAI